MSAKITAKAVSQVSEQLPSFISEEYPLFEKFTKNYFEFLESICVYYGITTGYETAYTFTVGETVTGSSTGATATVKGIGAFSGFNKLFLEPTNTLDFSTDDTLVGSTSAARGDVTKIVRNPVNALKTFSELIDPTTTSEGILKSYKKELYPNIRDSASVDLRMFIQHLKDFYRSKGSEKSVRTLFRLLFDQENLDLYYPKNDLLKISDGKWSQDVVLQLIYDSNYLNFNGLSITGSTSGSTAFVSTVTERKLGTISIIELVIIDRVGSFTIGETITATTAAGVVVSATISSQFTDVTITDGGTGYEVGDPLTITDSTNVGYGATANVSATTADQITNITVSNSGNGYQVNDVLVFDNTDTNVDATAAAKISQLKNTYQLDVVTSTLKEFIGTTSFNVSGASTALPFSIEVSTGYIVGNASTYADSTKIGEVVSITNSELVVYDRGNATSRLGLEDDSGYIAINCTDGGTADANDYIINETIETITFADTDTLYLFDSNGYSIAGATAVIIDDSSFTASTTDVLINATDYDTAGNTIAEKTGTYVRSSSTITATVSSGHNFALTGTYARAGTLVTATIPTGHHFLGVGTETFKAFFQSGTIDGTSDDTASFTVAGVSSTTVFTFNTSGTGTTTGSLDITKGTQYVNIDFAGSLHGTIDDNLSFQATYVNSTVFTATSTSGSEAVSGSMSLTNNANNVIINSLVFETQTFGAINAISITSHGLGYEALPSATSTNNYYKSLFEPDTPNGGYYGKNGAFTMGALGGTISDITITESGFGYITSPAVTASTNASSSSTAATLVAVMTDSKTKDGVFSDESGKPSSIKKIQDSDYYQDFSYVIKTADSINVWKQDVLKLIHPAGHKLFGEVSIATLLNAAMFDRGLNNINSVLATGLTQYRDLSLQLISEVLNNLYVTAETYMDREVQLDLFLDNSVYYGDVTSYDRYLYYEDGGVIIGEDDDKILAEIPREVQNSEFLPDNIIASVIEYLQRLTSTNGMPAEFFSLMSVKDISTFYRDSDLYLEYATDEGGTFLLEDGNKILAEETKITIHTSEPHYFHENDEIYLDDFEGINVDTLNGRLFSVSDVDIENSSILINSTDGTADAGDNILLETGGIMLNEDISIFTLGDPISLTAYGSLDIDTDDVTSDTVTITANGKIYRSGKSTSSGLPISLLNKEYIGEYSDYEIDPYLYHHFTDDLSSLTPDTVLEFDPYNIIIDQDGLLLEDDDEILLEDSLSPSHGSYSGTSSNLGKLIEEEIVMISEDTGGRIVLSEAERKVVLGSYLKDETTAGEDNIVLEDEDNIMLEESGVNAGVLTFDQPFDYVRQTGNNGFGYFKHRVDQRVSV